MDISGPIRALLQQFVKPEPIDIKSADPLTLYIYFVTWPHDPDPTAPAPTAASLPAFLAPDAPPLLAQSFSDDAGLTRPVYQYLTIAALLRVMPRLHRALRDHWVDGLLHHLKTLPDNAQKLLLARNSTAVDFLWHYWLLTLADQRLNLPIPDSLLKGLWRRGIAGTSQAPRLVPQNLPPEESALSDLCSLHAIYNTIAFTQNSDLLPPAEKIIDYHLKHPQAASTLTQPWALAAFAGLDDSATFAPQQLQRSTAQITTSPKPPLITLALLADALLTQEDAAGLS